MRSKSWILFLILSSLAAAFVLTSASTPLFSPHEKAFYASKDALSFARPGLVVKVLSAEIATDGTTKTRVRFTDPQGIPLDKDGVNSPGRISAGAPGMIVAVFQKDKNQFFAYTTRNQVSNITGNSAIQAGTDANGRWEKVADGEYTYTFNTKAPTGYDRAAVHAVGVYANRDLTEFDLGIQLDDDVYYFTPADGKAATNPHEEIKTATCHKCHGPNMAFHGETGRTSLAMCDLCHTQQTTDPDTGNTVDLRVMTHKIHMGEHLPSVAAGGKYQIIGFGNSVNDYSEVAFPAPVQKCEVCHEQKTGAAVTDAHLKNPSRAACGSCHDNVNFATGENHVNLPQVSDNGCINCHGTYANDFDISIKGAHVVPQESSLLSGIQWNITKVDDGTAGKKPTITFTLADKAGNPLAPSNFGRLAATIAGPTTDYNAFPTGYVQEDLLQSKGANGTYTYTFNSAIPANAKGTFAVGLEGRRVETVLGGTRRERSIQYGAKNPVMYFSVDGSEIQKRREPTSNENCLGCHSRLALHGENRVDNIEYCQFCHNPLETDATRRPAAQNPAQTIDFKFMVHRIHGGEELHTLFGTDYTVFGFGGAPISFSHVAYPGGLNQCFKCHTGGSENPTGALRTAARVNAPRYPINPMPPITNACYGCHDSVEMLAHAQANTTALGEACSVCHGPTAEFAPTKVHASEVTVEPGQSAH